MSARPFEAADAAPRAFDPGRWGGLTWLGLTVAALGWALLLGAAALTLRSRGADAPAIHGDLVEVARCGIGSGFALAVIGALQTGFGALNRFFSAVLTRSTSRPAPAPVPMPADTAAQVEIAAEPVRERRPYQILADGSVEVETIVGTRRFATMDEARDFI